ncbi:MAG: alpha/beta family hydrolase [Gemmatimonadota bacterium]|nr:alpha/beta family hydrolase [Gemmatimonadota bacterium]
MTEAVEGELEVTEVACPCEHGRGPVPGLLTRPDAPRALFVFGHGAGAGIRHPFMEATAKHLGKLGVSTLRYAFPYMAAGRKAPDPRSVLLATVRGAVEEATRLCPGVPLIAGGKSMGGRMTSLAQAQTPLPGIRGLAFFGFPLHPAGRTSAERGRHLADIDVPMLFLQGTRDRLANLDLLRPLLADAAPDAELHVVEGADHGFHVLKSSGRSDEDALTEACEVFADWLTPALGRTEGEPCGAGGGR